MGAVSSGVRPLEDEVVLSTDGVDPAEVFSRIDLELRSGRRVWLTGDLFKTLAGYIGREREGRRWVALSPRCHSQAWLYRARDMVSAALGLVILLPTFLAIALAVKLTSAGPVFFSTTVVGRGGRGFVWSKFRSMRPQPGVDAESERAEKYRAVMTRQTGGSAGGEDFKVVDTERVTVVGALLRKYSLDELPQLCSILRGDMSLVGPRPCLPYEADMFPDWASRRFDVRPGLTGVWQVYGRSQVGIEEMLAMDAFYTYARSFWGDVRLILATVPAVLRARGAR